MYVIPFFFNKAHIHLILDSTPAFWRVFALATNLVAARRDNNGFVGIEAAQMLQKGFSGIGSRIKSAGSVDRPTSIHLADHS